MNGRILVVDDDVALAEMVGIVLRAEGFEPLFCSHGDEALEAFRAGQPDLVLLDLMLPGKDGTEICRLIRAESGVPIVMLTAKSDTVDIVVGLESGADDYIPKPFKAKELIARVRARLRHNEQPSRQSDEILRHRHRGTLPRQDQPRQTQFRRLRPYLDARRGQSSLRADQRLLELAAVTVGDGHARHASPVGLSC